MMLLSFPLESFLFFKKVRETEKKIVWCVMYVVVGGGGGVLFLFFVIQQHSEREGSD